MSILTEYQTVVYDLKKQVRLNEALRQGNFIKILDIECEGGGADKAVVIDPTAPNISRGKVSPELLDYIQRRIDNHDAGTNETEDGVNTCFQRKSWLNVGGEWGYYIHHVDVNVDQWKGQNESGVNTEEKPETKKRHPHIGPFVPPKVTLPDGWYKLGLQLDLYRNHLAYDKLPEGFEELKILSDGLHVLTITKEVIADNVLDARTLRDKTARYQDYVIYSGKSIVIFSKKHPPFTIKPGPDRKKYIKKMFLKV